MFNKQDVFNKIMAKDVMENGGIYMIANQYSNLVMDVLGASAANGVQVAQFEQNNQPNQKFAFYDKGNGEWELAPQHATDCVLDICGASPELAARVQIYERNNTCAQRFKIVKNADSSYKIFTKSSDYKYCLAVNNDSKASGATMQQLNADAQSSNWLIVKL